VAQSPVRAFRARFGPITRRHAHHVPPPRDHLDASYASESNFVAISGEFDIAGACRDALSVPS
jgi:hypothetical protein